MAPKTQVGASVTYPLLKAIDARAKAMGWSRSETVRRALENVFLQRPLAAPQPPNPDDPE